jgi:hypothetical protein
MPVLGERENSRGFLAAISKYQENLRVANARPGRFFSSLPERDRGLGRVGVLHVGYGSRSPMLQFLTKLGRASSKVTR